MVAKILSRLISQVIVVPQLNYRTLKAEGVQTKIDLLYRSSVDDSSGLRGWKGDLVAEIVPLTNKAIYKMPRMVAAGIKDVDGLRKHYRSLLESKMSVAKTADLPYRAELVKVYEEMIAGIDACQEAILGAIHRGTAFPDVVAMWRHDKLKHSESIPCEMYDPANFDDLLASVHRRNGENLNQIEPDPADYIGMALHFKNNKYESQRSFRIFATTGSMNFSEAETKDNEDKGGKFSLFWNIAEVVDVFPELKIQERIGYDKEDKTLSEDKAKSRIELSRIQMGPPEQGDPLRRLQLFKLCAHPKLRAQYTDSSRGKSWLKNINSETVIGGVPIGKMIAENTYWTAEQIEQWWNNHCPGRFKDGKMPVTATSTTTVSLEKVQNLAQNNKRQLISELANSMLSVNGAESQVGQYIEANDGALNTVDAVYRLVRGDDALATSLLKVVNGLQALKDTDANTFRKSLDDMESVIAEAAKRLTTKTESPAPESGSESNPPTGKSKSPRRKATAS